MVAYKFKARFAAKVESGEKRQTIRKIRKRNNASPGKALQLYTGQRTRNCRKLLDTTCKLVFPIQIFDKNLIRLEGVSYGRRRVEQIARNDGFETVEEFIEFFQEHYGLPFEGLLITW